MRVIPLYLTLIDHFVKIPFINVYLYSQSPSGPGLAFVAFTEAMTKIDFPPIWSILFFIMLINLGLGSMFGTLEGILTPLSNLGLKIRKEIMVGK